MTEKQKKYRGLVIEDNDLYHDEIWPGVLGLLNITDEEVMIITNREEFSQLMEELPELAPGLMVAIVDGSLDPGGKGKEGQELIDKLRDLRGKEVVIVDGSSFGELKGNDLKWSKTRFGEEMEQSSFNDARRIMAEEIRGVLEKKDLLLEE